MCCVLCVARVCSVCAVCACCVRLAGECLTLPAPSPYRVVNQNRRLLSLWPPHAQYRSIFAGAYLHGPFVGRRQNAVRGAYWLGNLTKNAVRVCGFRKMGYSGCVPEGSYLALFRETRKK